MRMVMTTLVAALMMVAGPALAVAQQGQQPGQTTPGQQDQQQAQKQGQQKGAQKAYQATKHFAVINAGIQDAKLNAKMLSEISSDPRSYDQQHGELFVKNIRDSLRDTQTHLAHLRPMATTDEEKQQFTEISTHVKNAEQMLQPMQGMANDPKKISDASQKLESELDKSMDPLKQMASSMDAKIEIG